MESENAECRKLVTLWPWGMPEWSVNNPQICVLAEVRFSLSSAKLSYPVLISVNNLNPLLTWTSFAVCQSINPNYVTNRAEFRKPGDVSWKNQNKVMGVAASFQRWSTEVALHNTITHNQRSVPATYEQGVSCWYLNPVLLELSTIYQGCSIHWGRGELRDISKCYLWEVKTNQRSLQGNGIIYYSRTSRVGCIACLWLIALNIGIFDHEVT